MANIRLNQMPIVRHQPQFTYDLAGVLFNARLYKDQSNQLKLHWDVYTGNDFDHVYVRIGHPAILDSLHLVALDVFKDYSLYLNIAKNMNIEAATPVEYDLLKAKINKLYQLNL